MCGFYIILIRKKIWRFEIKGPILFFWTEWNFNKNEAESKMEKSTFRETNLTLKVCLSKFSKVSRLHKPNVFPEKLLTRIDLMWVKNQVRFCKFMSMKIREI